MTDLRLLGAGITLLTVVCSASTALAQALSEKKVLSFSEQFLGYYYGSVGTGVLTAAALLAILLCVSGQSRFGFTLLGLAVVGFSLRMFMTQQELGPREPRPAPFAVPIATPTKPPPQAVARRHGSGIDIFVGGPAEVKAITAGSVAGVGSSQANGGYLAVKQPDGVLVYYTQLAGIRVKKGQFVNRGDVLARVRDSFGLDSGRPHLHLEVRGAAGPVDPTVFVQGLQIDGTGKVINPNLLLPIPLTPLGGGSAAAPVEEEEEGMVSF